MPRKQMLSAITPNRYYHLEATLKYIHQTQSVTTAIIEQDNVQKKIKFPRMISQLQEGAQYSFQKCFYSKNGWIKVDDIQKIKLVEPKPNQFLTLSEAYESRNELNGHYITTILQIVEIGPTQKKMKNDNQLTLTIVKGFADKCLIDLTIWNKQISAELLGKVVILEGMRVKQLTNKAMVLVSTVYTKLHEVDEQQRQVYDPKNDYKLLSKVYSQQTIAQSEKELFEDNKSFSIISSTISDILIFDYEGCSKCRKKVEESACTTCGQGNSKAKYLIAQILIKDQTGQMVVFAFDQKLIAVLRLAKKGSTMTGRVKSTMRDNGEQKLASHVLTGVASIQF